MLELPQVHPNVVSLHYCVVAETEFLMFQDYVPGARDLKAIIQKKKIYEGTFCTVRSRILAVLIDTAEALRHLHAFGIMHQDVKSENVLIGDDGTALLADFGLARHGEGSGADLRVPFAGFTPGYDSPEVKKFAEEIKNKDRISVSCAV